MRVKIVRDRDRNLRMSEDYTLSDALPMCDYSQKGAVFSNI